MHSFHPSRGRIFFEAFCALAISASLAGAWMQTGAWALLPAAAVSALFGLAHAARGTGRKAAVVVGPPEMAFVANDQGDLLACVDAVERLPEPVEEAAPVHPWEEAEPVEPESLEEAYHAPIEPLFEPQPFARNQRPVFGRKTDQPVAKPVTTPKRRSRKKSPA